MYSLAGDRQALALLLTVVHKPDCRRDEDEDNLGICAGFHASIRVGRGLPCFLYVEYGINARLGAALGGFAVNDALVFRCNGVKTPLAHPG